MLRLGATICRSAHAAPPHRTTCTHMSSARSAACTTARDPDRHTAAHHPAQASAVLGGGPKSSALVVTHRGPNAGCGPGNASETLSRP